MTIRKVLAVSGLAPEYLDLEITDLTMAEDMIHQKEC